MYCTPFSTESMNDVQHLPLDGGGPAAPVHTSGASGPCWNRAGYPEVTPVLSSSIEFS